MGYLMFQIWKQEMKVQNFFQKIIEIRMLKPGALPKYQQVNFIQRYKRNKPRWRVLKLNGLDVHAEPEVEAEKTGKLKFGKNIVGFQHGNWVNHSGGWSLIAKEGKTLLRMEVSVKFKPHEFGFYLNNDVVSDVEQDSQAAQFGVCIGWCIVSINGVCTNIQNISAFILRELSKTKCLGLETTITFSPPLEVRVSFEPKAPGVTFYNDRVINIQPGGQASKLGLCVGWHAVSINGELQLADCDISSIFTENLLAQQNTEFLFKLPRPVFNK